jgi:hypothetical protein
LPFSARATMWWKLAGLALVAIVLVFVIVSPIPTQTVEVTVDLPPGATIKPGDLHLNQVQKAASVAAYGVEAALVGAVLAVSAWIARRIVRKHRQAS